jgi:hypothetical protein
VVSTVTATVIDATPIQSIPTNLPALPTGHYSIPLGDPTESCNGCLKENSQQATWACSSHAYLNLTVVGQDLGATKVYLTSAAGQGGPQWYGPQPPSLCESSEVSLARDINDPELGLAFFFSSLYDKLVVLHEGELSNDSSLTPQDLLADAGDGPFMAVLPGEKLWFCWWNNTVVEGFIYIFQNSAGAAGNDTSLIYSILAAEASATAATAPETTSASGQQSPWPSGIPKVYPKVVKIEEVRESENPVKPYCELMQMRGPGDFSVVEDSSGKPTVVQLDETEPETQRRLTYEPREEPHWPSEGEEFGERLEVMKRDGSSGCHCEWLSD